MLCLLIFATPDTISVAQMAKLVDALCSGRSACKGVLVRIQFWALERTNFGLSFFILRKFCVWCIYQLNSFSLLTLSVYLPYNVTYGRL